MKKICVALTLLLCLLQPTVAFADVVGELVDSVNDGLGNIDFSDFDSVGSDFVGSAAEKIRKIVNGEFDDASDFFSVFVELFFAEFTQILPQLLSLFAVMIICGILRRTSGGFVSQSTEEVVSFVGVAVSISVVLSLVAKVFVATSDLLGKVSALSEASAPITLALLIANGNVALQSVYRTSTVIFSSLIIGLVKSVILPLAGFSVVFGVVSRLSGNLRVEKLSSFFSNLSAWILGVAFMLFSAFTATQGITAGSVDGVSVRAAKFAAKNYIPFLGGYVAEGLDLVLASSALIKNAFGAVALLVLLWLVFKPVAYVLCVNLGLQIVGAICQPVAEDKFVKLLASVEKNLNFFVALIVAVAFMFAIQVLITLGISSV